MLQHTANLSVANEQSWGGNLDDLEIFIEWAEGAIRTAHPQAGAVLDTGGCLDRDGKAITSDALSKVVQRDMWTFLRNRITDTATLDALKTKEVSGNGSAAITYLKEKLKATELDVAQSVRQRLEALVRRGIQGPTEAHFDEFKKTYDSLVAQLSPQYRKPDALHAQDFVSAMPESLASAVLTLQAARPDALATLASAQKELKSLCRQKTNLDDMAAARQLNSALASLSPTECSAALAALKSGDTEALAAAAGKPFKPFKKPAWSSPTAWKAGMTKCPLWQAGQEGWWSGRAPLRGLRRRAQRAQAHLQEEGAGSRRRRHHHRRDHHVGALLQRRRGRLHRRMLGVRGWLRCGRLPPSGCRARGHPTRQVTAAHRDRRASPGSPRRRAGRAPSSASSRSSPSLSLRRAAARRASEVTGMPSAAISNSSVSLTKSEIRSEIEVPTSDVTTGARTDFLPRSFRLRPRSDLLLFAAPPAAMLTACSRTPPCTWPSSSVHRPRASAPGWHRTWRPCSPASLTSTRSSPRVASLSFPAAVAAPRTQARSSSGRRLHQSSLRLIDLALDSEGADPEFVALVPVARGRAALRGHLHSARRRLLRLDALAVL